MESVIGLNRKRGSVKAQITRIEAYLDSEDIVDADLIELQARLESMERTKVLCEDIKFKFYEVLKDEEMESNEDEFVLLEERLGKVEVRFKRLIFSKVNVVNNEEPVVNSNSKVYSKLPDIPLPQFSGEYEEWNLFKSRFNSLISANGQLSETQKLYYLQGALIKEAKQIETSDDTFSSLMKALEDRYENKRLIVDTHINALLSIERVNSESAKDLRALLDNVLRQLRALKLMGLETNNFCEVILINVILKKLDRESRQLYETSLASKELPNWDEFITFLQNRCQILESIQRNYIQGQGKQKVFQGKSRSFLVKAIANKSNCLLCKKEHSIYKCKRFHEMSVPERYDFARKMRLCFNCLYDSHRNSDCKSKGCNSCGRRHHTLLHNNSKVTEKVIESKPDEVLNSFQQKAENQESEECQSMSITNCCVQGSQKKCVLLSTAVVFVQDSLGTFQPCRALLDSASQSNFVTVDCATRLGLKTQKVQVAVAGLNGSVITINKKIRTVISESKNVFRCSLELMVVPKITGIVPAKRLEVSRRGFPNYLSLADPEFDIPSKIDVLLGAEVFFELLKGRQFRLPDRNLILQETVFGWIVGGSLKDKFSTNPQYCHLSQELDSLDRNIRRFWELESINEHSTIKSNEEIFCEEHFQKTHFRNEEGRYVVQLPLKEEKTLGDSLVMATRRLNSLKRRLDKDPKMQVLYSNFIQEYELLNHMERVSEGQNPEGDKVYYMPHHGVYKPENSSTKLRVVFDASAVTSSGESLNGLLLNGGVIQEDLFSILLRFRKHKYVFTADIVKMYRQILVNSTQRDLQRIVWKDGLMDEMKIYRLSTVTYGTACAPYLAMRVLKQLALDEQIRFPLASAVTLTDFYMDDVLTGTDDFAKTKEIQHQLLEMLKSCGMKLHKWCSNSTPLLRQISQEDQVYHFDDSGQNQTVKTLGLIWYPDSDSFSFKVKASVNSPCTKRSVLSDIARLFDPLGLIGPVIAQAKIFMQRLWLLKLDWQEELPKKEASEWNEFLAALPFINDIRIERYVLSVDISRLELHGFADASERAYGAVLYLRCVMKTNQVKSHLLCSKSRVSPLKQVTIPRLELCAALLLSHLLAKAKKSLHASIQNVVLWSDSTIVLAWINTSPHLLKTFVANRVSTIQEITSECQWGHIKSEENPADLLSRGLSPDKLMENNLWWYGPEFLRQNQQLKGGTDGFNLEDKAYLHEVKSLPEKSLLVISSDSWIEEIIDRSSNYMKIVRVVSYVRRFVHNMKNLNTKQSGPVSSEEIREAIGIVLRAVQEREFSEEFSSLENPSHQKLRSKSKLKGLDPFVDKDGLLRVGGRLTHANLTFDQKHQIVLPKGHKLTQLIFEHFHLKNLHVGPQSLLYFVRQAFWPINGRSCARKIVNKCVTCFRNKPTNVTQLMGNLPSERVNPRPPFDICGVDFCGPFYIKYKGQRTGALHKIYVAIFICFVTKAIHLEIVTDLTAEAFLACLKRFFARRGKSSTLFSDNATNFVGANNELKRLHNLMKNPDENVAEFLSNEGISWRFLPPRAPNFGGLWEAGVKSFKHHLKRAVRDSKLTLEEFQTITIQIEAVLNSRPITALSSAASDLEALTPGHFLIGRPLNTLPEPDLMDKRDNRLSRWQRNTKMVQSIWKRWHRDYLSHLQQRSKWQFAKKNVKPGLLVLVKEDNLPPSKWVLGRILDIVPGPDGRVRVVTLRTRTGVFKRCISKICILPIEDC